MARPSNKLGLKLGLAGVLALALASLSPLGAAESMDGGSGSAGANFAPGDPRGFPGVRQAPASPTGQACFYSEANFRGQRLCLRSEGGVPLLTRGWNDRISSIELSPGLLVTACEQANYGGRCVDYDRSVAFVEPRMKDRISSVRVRPAYAR